MLIMNQSSGLGISIHWVKTTVEPLMFFGMDQIIMRLLNLMIAPHCKMKFQCKCNYFRNFLLLLYSILIRYIASILVYKTIRKQLLLYHHPIKHLFVWILLHRLRFRLRLPRCLLLHRLRFRLRLPRCLLRQQRLSDPTMTSLEQKLN